MFCFFMKDEIYEIAKRRFPFLKPVGVVMGNCAPVPAKYYPKSDPLEEKQRDVVLRRVRP